MLDPTTVSPSAYPVDDAGREPSDAEFVGDLSGLDDDDDDDDDDDFDADENDATDDDEVISDAHQTTTVISDDDQATTSISDGHEVTTIISKQAALEARREAALRKQARLAERLALEARILNSRTPLAELIEQEVARFTEQVERDVAGIDPDEVTIDGFNARETWRSQVPMLRRQLEAAVTPPSDWPCRRTQLAAARRERWQRLRLLQAVDGLRGCVRRVETTWGHQWRACELHSKQHCGWSLSGTRVEKVEDPCQVGELRSLSMKLGELTFYMQFRPQCHKETGELVAPSQWPSESTKVGRGMVAQLWSRFRAPSGQHDQDPGSSLDAPHTRGPAGLSSTPDGARLAAAAWRTRRDHVVHSEPTTITEDGAPAVVETMLPESLLQHRDAIGDHGLWVLNLLRTPLDPDKVRDRRAKAEAKAGWHRVSTKKLRLILGKVSAGPQKRAQRADLLLGTREAPGLLERLALIERLTDYSAGYKPMAYRLVPKVATGKLVDVTLVLRKRLSTLPRTKRVVGPAVPASLVHDYARLRLDEQAALRDLCAAIGIEFSLDLDAISTAAAKHPEAATFQAAIEVVRSWAEPGAAAQESKGLYRDASGWRLQSSFARMPRALRKHMTFDDGRPLVGLDIKASQLVIGAGRLRAEGRTSEPGIVRWVDCCENDDIYGVLFELQHSRRPSAEERDAFKDEAFANIIYCGPGWMESRKNLLAQAVKREFPEFFWWLLKEKQRVGHAAYCCDNQRFESKIVLDQLAPLLAEAGILVATVHDCIYVRDVDADRARDLFEHVLRSAGVCPPVSAKLSP